MNFSTDFVTPHHNNWTAWLGHWKDKPDIHALEIGSFEGRSAIWFLENILTAENSTILCSDTFSGGEGLPVINDNAQLSRFLDNTNPWESKIEVHRGPSSELPRHLGGRQFHFAYIDGSHTAANVINDAITVWYSLLPGGVIIFDDYGWNVDPNPENCPKMAIDAFLECFSGKYDLIFKDWQVVVRKH